MKHDQQIKELWFTLVAPPTWAGRGLKPEELGKLLVDVKSRPAHVGGARIETPHGRTAPAEHPGRPAHVGGARIETLLGGRGTEAAEVAPPTWAGRGLKPSFVRTQHRQRRVAPPTWAGRGLKQR